MYGTGNSRPNFVENKIFSRVTTDLEYDGYSLFPQKDGSLQQSARDLNVYNGQECHEIYLDRMVLLELLLNAII